MTDFDVIVIGAGAAGEAAAYRSAELGGRVAVIERELVGGECSFWACVPSKSLLDSAGRRALGASYPWTRASDRRDWNISREQTDYPDDSGHEQRLKDAGVTLLRGTALITGKDRAEVKAKGGSSKTLTARSMIVATGSVPVIPPVDGLTEAGYWTNREATSTRDLPSSMVIMGGGPMGVETAQIYARFGCRITLIDSNNRILSRDHPSSSATVFDHLLKEGVEVRTDVRVETVERGGQGRRVTLSDGSKVDAAELLVAVGRRPSDLKGLGLEAAGIVPDGAGMVETDESMAIGDGLYIAGDAAGGLQFTHVADYQGRVAGSNAMGVPTKVDLSAVPRCTFTDPETAAVGLTIEEAQASGVDAFEVTQDFTQTARGNTIEGSTGHVTLVVDKGRKTLTGVFVACPGASEMIHVAVLAVRQQTPLQVLADLIYQFPTGARVFGNLTREALRKL